MKAGTNPRVCAAAMGMLIAGIVSFAQPLAAQGLREQDVTREFGYITMRDGVRLAYVTYRPSKAGTLPILLEFSPYGMDAAPFTAAKAYLDRGYAFAGVDIRGTSCSTGTLSMFDPILAADGAQVVEFLGGQPWSSGAVGMVGMSYPGHTQIFTASKHPKYLKAIAPGSLTAGAYREAWYPGGMFNQSFIGGWAFSNRADAAERRIGWGDKDCNLAHAQTSNRGTYYELREHALQSDWWKPRDLETYIADVQVPTMMEQAWQDHQTQISAAIHLFERLGAINKRILLQPGGHFAYRRDISMDEVLRWMDHWLKGVDNGVEKEPPVKVFWEVTEANGKSTENWTTSYASWPPPNARPMTFYLSPDGALGPTTPGSSKDNGARSYTYPLATELVGDNEQFALRPQNGGFLSYRTAPMTEDTTVLGFSQLTFYLSSEQKDTDVLIVLHDVDEQGNVLYLTRDYLRASLRALDPAKSTAEERVRAFTKAEPLTPGQVYEMKLSIPPLGHVIRAGHSLELGILAPSPIGQPNWGVMILDLPGRNTVYHSAQYPSSLTLSVLPGVRAKAAAPPCGVMPFQPCRHAPQRPAQATQAAR